MSDPSSGEAQAARGRMVYRVEHRRTCAGPYQLRDKDDLPVLSGFDMPLPWKDSQLVRQLPEGVPHYKLGLLSVCVGVRDLYNWFREARGAEALHGWDMVARAYWVPEREKILVGRGQALVAPGDLRRPAIAEVGFEDFHRFGPAGLEWAVTAVMKDGVPAVPTTRRLRDRLAALMSQGISMRPPRR